MSLSSKYNSNVNSVLHLLSGGDDVLLREFIRQFYAFSYSGILELGVEFLLSMARSLYEFSKVRSRQQIKVRLFCAKEQNEEFTIIEVVSDDCPFLVDSILETIKSFDFEILHYTNAILQIERDGVEIKNIITSENLDPSIQESIICLIIKSVDRDLQVRLQCEIERAVKAVHCCVTDWKPMLSKIDELQKNAGLFSKFSDAKETIDLLSWLQNGNFVFLGYQEYKLQGSSMVACSEGLGLKKMPEFTEVEITPISTKDILAITRSTLISIVHRRVNMNCISIFEFDKRHNLQLERCFFGLFTSTALMEDVRNIPVIRKKVLSIEKRSGFAKNGHNNKSLLSVLQSFSREELFCSSEDDLFEISMGILSLSIAPRVKLFVRNEVTGDFIDCMVFVPKNCSSTELSKKITSILEKRLSSRVIANDYHMSNESPLVRMQFVLQNTQSIQISEQQIIDTEIAINDVTKRWGDRFVDIVRSHGALRGSIFAKYRNAFPIDYQEYFSPEIAYHDVVMIERFLQFNHDQVDLYLVEGYKNYRLKIYTAEKSGLQLSVILNIIKNTGMSIILHYSYLINVASGVCIHYFVLSGVKSSFDNDQIEEQFEMMLSKVFAQEMENDHFNSLVLLAGLCCKEVLLLRAIGCYMKQISFGYSQSYIQKTLSMYPQIVHELIELFHARFDPDVVLDRGQTAKILVERLEGLLSKVSDVVHDYVLRYVLSLIMAIVRTNYYLPGRSFLSIKFNSAKIPGLVLPHPFREIYVYSNSFEAIHLRGNKLSRGGLRWSDRTEDFRTEVLGLMKAQMTKNSVIVPVGAKGGFILKHCKNVDRVELLKRAIDCYQNFLRGLLDVTDNVGADGSMISAGVVCDDDYDPYLVVAADKGTSSFSDFANEISREYNFWMGDAFASGGSYGYDHKKMGITSRGAWVAMQRHFWKMGRSVDDGFSAIAIGDMSGDLFGNGMILSPKIKLIAAFNHQHIFIDPNPDLEKSFAERKRLFALPTSTWADYDKLTLSKGGDIFDRKAKSLSLSSEVKRRLDIDVDSISPNELIKKILTSKVDLLWNGGIGTFVKSSQESNSVACDKDNDAIRVNGQDLRVLVVIEGGNLGFTQLGRVEYARQGGYINTDFMDNSGGVICSDFEVNIKIAFKVAMERNLLSFENRNEILESMTDEIVHMVLDQHSKLETKALVIETLQSQQRLEQHCRLLQNLERTGKIDRAIEYLPTDEEIMKMLNEARGFVCPQIAVLISYARMAIKDELMSSSFMDDEKLSHYLVDYFPHRMREQFVSAIIEHPLRREIVAICITNEVVNRMGCVFVNHISENTGVRVDLIVKVYVTMSRIYGLYDLWMQIDSELDSKIEIEKFYEVVRELQRFCGQAVFWCLRNMSKIKDLEMRLDEMVSNVHSLKDHLLGVLDSQALDEYNRVVNPEDRELIREIYKLRFLSNALDIIYLAEEHQLSVLEVAKIHFKLKSSMHFMRIREMVKKIEESSSYWQKVSIRDLVDDLDCYQNFLTSEVLKLKNQDKGDDLVQVWLDENTMAVEAYSDFLGKINISQLDLSKLVILVKRFKNIVVQGVSRGV